MREGGKPGEGEEANQGAARYRDRRFSLILLGTLEGRLCPVLSQPDARDTGFHIFAPGSQSQKCQVVPGTPHSHHPPPALVTVNLANPAIPSQLRMVGHSELPLLEGLPSFFIT